MPDIVICGLGMDDSMYGGRAKQTTIRYKGESRRVPTTYIEGLKGADLKKQIKSIFEETDRPKDVKFKSKRSPWCEKFEEKYGTKITDMDFIDKNLLEKEGQEKIIDKGKAAYYSSGSRPKQNPYSWGKARLCSVLMNGKARKIDQKIFNEHRVLKLTDVKEINKDKRFEAVFSDGKKVKFGQTDPTKGTFIDPKDEKIKDAYVSRHAKDLKTNDPQRAGYLSMFILWNKSSLSSAIKDYNKRLKDNDWSLP